MMHPPVRALRAIAAARPHAFALAFSLIFALLAGCGGGSSDNASDPDVPLQGRQLSKPNQLLGAWMFASKGDFTGLEFMKDGNALVSRGRSVATLKYAVIDGGRLSLTDPNGRSSVFGVTLAGDALEITAENPFGSAPPPQRFQKVPSGQTLAQAIQERSTQLQAARQARFAKLEALLAADDLVLIAADTPGPAAVFAVKINHWQPQIGGAAIMVDDPARIDALSPVRVHPISGRIDPLDEFSDRLKITLQFQTATEPAWAQPSQGSIELVAEGPIDDQKIAGPAVFAKSWPGEARFALARNSRLHKANVAALETQKEAARKAIAAASSPLGGRARLIGEKTVPKGPAEPIELRIERVGESDAFTARVAVGSKPEADASGSVELLLGTGALYLNLATGEQWRLQTKDEGKTYAGAWRPNARSDFLGYGEVKLETEQIWSIAQVAAEKQAKQRFLAKDLRSPQRFTGFIRSGRAGDEEHWPVSLQLQAVADGSLAGEAWLVGQNVGVALAGRVADGMISLSSNAVLAGSANTRSFTQQNWQLSLSAMEPQPQLSGSMRALSGGSGSAELTLVDPKKLKTQQQELLKALRQATFTVVNTTISRRDEPTFFRLQADPDSGAVTGDAIGADLTGSTSRALPPGLISGAVETERDLILVKLVATGSPEPLRGRPGESFSYTLAPRRLDDGSLALTGWGEPGRGNQTWLTLLPFLADEPIEVSPEQALRLAAQRLGAVAEPPTDPKPGESVIILQSVTDRDARVGQLFFADGRYTHRNSVPAAAIHAGLAQPGEICVLKLTYGPPFTAPVTSVESNGIASSPANFRPNNPLPTFALERIEIE